MSKKARDTLKRYGVLSFRVNATEKEFILARKPEGVNVNNFLREVVLRALQQS